MIRFEIEDSGDGKKKIVALMGDIVVFMQYLIEEESHSYAMYLRDVAEKLESK